MALSIKSPEVERKVRKLAATTGESLTIAISLAVEERLAREERKRTDKEALLADIRSIIDHCSSLPILDNRSEDEIMGWDENGLPS
jgi:antitoxin VapB